MKTRNAARRHSKAAIGRPADVDVASLAVRPLPRRAAPVPTAEDVALLAIGRRAWRDFAREFIRCSRDGDEFSDALLAAMRVGFPRSHNATDATMRERGKAILNLEPVFDVVRSILDDASATGGAEQPRPMTPLETVIAYPEMLPRCTACNSRTFWRKRKDGHGPSFVGCGNYPKCRESLSLAELERMLARRNRSKTLSSQRAAEARKRRET